jgi:glycosyltransferase involved in cell wall biosynthesis
MLPVISVIMPVYNSGSKLRNSITSVLDQEGNGTVFDIQMLVIDDCSTDNSTEILREMGVRYLVNKTNSGGPNRGRNRGLKAATGDYICFIDHDDIWHPRKLVEQLKVAKEFSVITCGHITMEPETGKTRQAGGATGETITYASNETFLARMARLNTGQNTYMSTIMIEASLKEILFEEDFGSIDFDWLLRIFHNNKSAQVDLPLVTRVVEQENLSLKDDYRIKEYNYALKTLEKYRSDYPSESLRGIKRTNGTRARYHYMTGDMKSARRFFLRSEIRLKTMLYIVTSFAGSKWVKRRFHIFG